MTGWTEADLLTGVTDALELAGWTWMHIIRSDGVTMGDPGFPDVMAVHPTLGNALALELKTETGQPTRDQLAWILGMKAAGIDARVVRPSDYDELLRVILAARS